MKRWIASHPKEAFIALVVLTGHLAFFFTQFKTEHPMTLPKEAIVVRTHVLPKPSPPPRRVKPPASQPTIQKKGKSPQKKKEPPSLFKELEQKLSQVEKKGAEPSSTSSLDVPRMIQDLQINENDASSSYLSLLVQTLKSQLKLPDEGRVRLQMTLLKTGRVEKVRIVYAESENNKTYLERELIHLTLPPFSEELAKKQKYTFTFTFCHENET